MPEQEHGHEGMVHDHEHVHVTHYLRPEEDWVHLMARHGHEHNHAHMDHAHYPHEDFEKEHAREAHVHDHERPQESPA